MDQRLFITDLSKLAKMSREQITSIEKGYSTNPEMSTLIKISQALKKPIWFLGCFDLLPEKTFAQRLKKARLYAGLTKQDLSKILKVDHKYVANWESEKWVPKDAKMKDLNKFIEEVFSQNK
ncbi:MAG: helix-turn-helix transcriptional regulator [Sporomusaceae bacterium]|nr:helix-turn-helix transcriptional regulator [Sporomusaceae bacterium]